MERERRGRVVDGRSSDIRRGGKMDGNRFGEFVAHESINIFQE